MTALENCEHYERLASTGLDHTLAHAEQVELMDHLVRCSDCRDFYRDARALDGLVAAVRPSEMESDTDVEELPTEMWEAIERRAGVQQPRRLPTWIGWAASFVVVALGLGVAFQGLVVTGTAPAEIEVQLGADRGRMSDDRFVNMTTELLEADPRYRSAMLNILERVERDTRGMEASIEDPVDRLEDSDTGENGLGSRIPA